MAIDDNTDYALKGSQVKDLASKINGKAETSSLSAVATSGSYNDLSNKPTIPAAQVQSDWTQSDNTKVDYIKNKPSLATVATSGSYNDLSSKPTIPTVNDSTITITNNGSTVDSFTTNASAGKTIALSAPVITMQTTDPGEGAVLAANHFIGVYE